ncbi:gamma-glutamylcyclotransferase family protein [Psychrobacter sp. HD31]|uniref:gamma-glutamylcyclotransferase family protein n=1 Tax=Psychrobacter sp. HD31 TaxID=3112003 RepID=UPI003DA55ADA
MQKLFSYGTLQQENVQLETFGRKLNGVQDVLLGYVLGEVRITDPNVLKASGKEYHPILVHTGNDSNEVQGTIFEITDDELAQADEYEVDDYARVSAKFKSGTTAWVYADARQV